MTALKLAVTIAWIVFWVYWLASAIGAHKSAPGRRRIPVFGLTAVGVILVVRVFRGGSLVVHSPVLAGVGAALFLAGLTVAIWARVCLGRNWGMPMTRRLEPELITSGPYRLIRHPIYSGLLLAMLGTALVINPTGLIVAAALGAYFYYSATVEERNLVLAFPAAYPEYRTRTKKLIPFVL